MKKEREMEDHTGNNIHSLRGAKRKKEKLRKIKKRGRFRKRDK